MPPAITSPRLEAIFQRENFVLRDDLQQDKRATLLAVARMFDDHQVPYVITDGLAVQLYNIETRPTVDIDVVTPRKPFEQLLKTKQPWARYGFELVFDRRRFIKLRHLASNVDVDINTDTRFVSLLEDPNQETVEGQPILFTAPERIAFAKLRTQRLDWPRDPVRRLQDRTDLMQLLRAHPEIGSKIRDNPLTTDEMRQILDDILRELSKPSSDELPPENDDAD